MKVIMRNMLASGKIEDICIFDSEVTRWLHDHGARDNAISKITAYIPTSGMYADLKKAEVHGMLLDFLDRGYTLEGVKQKCVMLTASDGRKATSTWVDADLVPELGKWMYCGLKPQEVTLAVNKFMAYLGLLMSTSKRFEEIFGRAVDVRRIAVIPDGYVDVDGNVDFVTMTTVDKDVERTVRINAFDGFGIINAELTDGKSQTLRMPWGKIFAQATDWGKLNKFALDNGVAPVFKDYWGNECRLYDYDLIVTESCFKAVKLYHSWDQYATAFEEFGHNVCVCVQEHEPRLKGLPYQQGQTLLGDEYDAQMLADRSVSIMAKYSDQKEATNMLSGWLKKTAYVYPALLKERHTARSIQEKYTSKINEMLGGRIPELGWNAFLAPDPVAFAQHLFGLPVTGYLKAGECYCTTCREGEVDVTRNPHFDNAHVVLNAVEMCPLAQGPTFFINVYDMTTIRLRADYDGDHVWYSQNEYLLGLVHKTYKIIGNLPIDWDAPSALKVKITRGTIADYVANLLHSSEIGIYADLLTKMWAWGYDRDVCDWLTYAGNVLIDAAKHGSVKIEMPEAVKELREKPLPWFAAHAKADKEHPVGPYWFAPRFDKDGNEIPPRCVYSESFLDMYARDIDEQVPKTLEVSGLENLVFNPAIMMIKPDRHIGKLKGLSLRSKSLNPETGKYEDGGLFQQIAFRHSAEWNAFRDDVTFKMNQKEWDEFKKNEAQREIISWARDKYADDPRMNNVSDEKILETCYDIITRNVFNTTKGSDGYDTAIKNAYWRIFGEMAYKATVSNLGDAALEVDWSAYCEYDDLDEEEGE